MPTRADASPLEALRAGRDAVSDFLLRSGPSFSAEGPAGWRGTADAVACLEELATLVALFPQVHGHLAGAVRREHDAGRLSVTDGDHAGAPGAASAELVRALERATTDAHHLWECLTEARTALAGGGDRGAHA